MRNVLYVGPTRPSTVWGIPFEAWIAVLLITAFLFLGTGSLWMFLAAPPLYGISWLICLRDPRGFELAWQWLNTKARSVSRAYWGAASRGPWISRMEAKRNRK